MREKENKANLPKELFGASMFMVVIFFGYLSFEPAVINAANPDTIDVTATVTSDVAISSPADVVLSGTIGGVAGGFATGSAVFNVKTSNTTGYSLKVHADQADTLNLDGTNHFDDYSATPTYAWTLGSGSGFGFTVNMPVADVLDTATAFRDTGAACGSGTSNSDNTCWRGFDSTNDIEVVNRTTATDAAGTDVTLAFEAMLVSGTILPPGSYVATITVTGTPTP